MTVILTLTSFKMKGLCQVLEENCFWFMPKMEGIYVIEGVGVFLMLCCLFCVGYLTMLFIPFLCVFYLDLFEKQNKMVTNKGSVVYSNSHWAGK